MATDLCEGAFQPNSANKRPKMITKFQNFNVKAVKILGIDPPFYVLFRKVIYLYLGGLSRFYGGTCRKFGLKERHVPFFQGFRSEYDQKVPKWMGGL